MVYMKSWSVLRMKKGENNKEDILMRRKNVVFGLVLSVFLLSGLFSQEVVQAFTLKVVDQDGKPVKGFRYLVEEDTTYEVIPGAIVSDSPGVGIHKSYAPVAKAGHSNAAEIIIDLPAKKRYFVSVLPDKDHAMGAASIKAHQQNAKVVVQTHPIPTAQISVLIFHDNNPINNTPDPPFEEGLAGFSIVVRDQLGLVSQDAFGNPLGTTYQQNPDGTFVLDADGNPVVAVIGTGVILTDATGRAFVKYLPPGKYGVQATPPPDKASWTQTATIEGTPGIDAWVKANEPPFFVEFGPTIQHAFIGFVEDGLNLLPATPGAAVTGQFVKFHTARPPLILAATGAPVPEALFGLNDLSTPTGQGVYTGRANPDDGTFTIPNLPPGTYQLVMWDVPLDYIFNFSTIIVNPGDTAIDLGQVPINSWFGTWKGSVFNDTNENGIRDCVTPACDDEAAGDEVGLSQQTLDVRFRDGSIYVPPFLTDVNGNYEFVEYFPWFHMTVAEVNYTRMKATGATISVDDGGGAATCGADPEICPQLQPDNAGLPYRTELSGDIAAGTYNPILLEASIVYSDQTNIIDWGKKDYAAGENGGIVGVVYYSTTRAEDDPRLAAAETWEPGIARVPVNLYQDDGTGKIFDLNGNGKVDLRRCG